MRVAIVFEGSSAIEAGYDTEDISSNASAISYMNKLENKQNTVLKRIADKVYGGKSLKTRYSFTMTTNAVSADVEYGDIEAIREVDGVEAVYILRQYELEEASPDTTTAADMIGSMSVWDNYNGYTGAGMKVAIIDTGIDYDHQSFDSGAYEYSLSLADPDNYNADDIMDVDDISAVLDQLHAYNEGTAASADELYVNSKIPFGYNYIDESTYIDHSQDAQGDHGTHVSGIAAANRYIPDGNGGYEDAVDTVSAVGVAPDAQILTMKVFGKAGGAYADDYVAAIEDAILLGADAINLSLGTANAGFTDATVDSGSTGEWEQGVFDGLDSTSTIVSIAAGNAYYWSYYSYYGANLTQDVELDTVGSPGSYTNALTVASADNTGETGYTFVVGENKYVYAETSKDSGVETKNFYSLDTNGNGTEYEYVALAPGKTGVSGDYTDIDVEGKIVLVQRGTETFANKAINAVANGAVGVIIYNNEPGTISASVSGYSGAAPVVTITQDDGLAIIEDSEENVIEVTTGSGIFSRTTEVTYYTGTMTVNSNIEVNHDVNDAIISDYSSWGGTGDLGIKPEITAPGGSIWSTLDNGEYGIYSGTSMAAPSVTGMSALVMQYIKANDLEAKTGLGIRQLAQSLLMSTAVPLTDPNSSDGSEYSVRNQGAGLANVNAAVNTEAFITVDGQDDGKVKAELGDDPDRTGKYSFSFDVTNFGDDVLIYDLGSSVLTADVWEDYYMDISDVTLAANVNFSLDSVSGGMLVNDLNGDGEVDNFDALLVLQYANGKTYALSDDQLGVADLSGDGQITVIDAYMWLKAVGDVSFAVETEESVSSLYGGTLTVGAGETASVSVSVNLKESGKNWLDENYENGGYVEGYIYLYGEANDEGLIAVDMSVPFLAFYGNWADPSMFEINEFIDWYYAYYVTDDDWTANYAATYVSDMYTNYFTYNVPGEGSYYFLGNNYEDDDEYIAARNAINSEDDTGIGNVVYSLIRNAADVIVTVEDADTGEIYYEKDLGAEYAEFYYSTISYWYYTSLTGKINWTGTDLEGEPLEEGTNVIVKLTALTEYGTTGEGSSLELPLTVDNTKPEIIDVAWNLSSDETGLDIIVEDNEYVAAVQIYSPDGMTLVASGAANQTEQGKASTVTISDTYIVKSRSGIFFPVYEYYTLEEYIQMQEETEGTSLVDVVVIDYAGNSTTYRVFLEKGEDFTDEATSVLIYYSGADVTDGTVGVLKNNSAALDAVVYPLNVSSNDVTWSSSDETVAKINEKGVISGISEGTATITATSVLSDEAIGKCTVEVYTIDVGMNSLYWDENGVVHEAVINTKDLSTYEEKLNLGGMDFWAQTPGPDGTVYAATSTSDYGSQYSDIYTLNLADGSYSYVTSTYWMTDMTYGEYTNSLYGTYGPYLIVVPLDDPDTWFYFDFEDDLGLDLGDDYVVGIDFLFGMTYTLFGITESDDYFMVITDSGMLYEVEIATAYGMWLGASAELSSHSLGVDVSWYYDSLYYYYDEETDDEFIFFSGYDSGTSTQTLYDIEYNEYSDWYDTLYVIDDFPDEVWPVSGLCDLSGSAGYNSDSLVGTIADELSSAAAEITPHTEKNLKPLSSRGAMKSTVSEDAGEEDISEQDISVDETENIQIQDDKNSEGTGKAEETAVTGVSEGIIKEDDPEDADAGPDEPDDPEDIKEE